MHAAQQGAAGLNVIYMNTVQFTQAANRCARPVLQQGAHRCTPQVACSLARCGAEMRKRETQPAAACILQPQLCRSYAAAIMPLAECTRAACVTELSCGVRGAQQPLAPHRDSVHDPSLQEQWCLRYSFVLEKRTAEHVTLFRLDTRAFAWHAQGGTCQCNAGLPSPSVAE